MGTLKLLTLKYSYHLKNHKMFKLLVIVALAVAVEAGYGYRGYGGYGYRSYGYHKREAEAEPGYGYRSYGYHKREAEASILNLPYAGALGYAGLPYTYAVYPIHVPSLVAYPNGAVTPADEPAVQAAKANHFAAKAAAYSAAPLAIADAPIAVAPAAHIIHKGQAAGALALVGAGAIGFGLGALKASSYGRGGYGRGYRYGKRSAVPGYGYRSYGYGRRYGGYGYGYRSYGYGY